MKPSTFKRLLHYMKGTMTSYAIGLIGLSLLTFLLQAVLALLFLNLFDTLAEGTFQELLDNILFYTIAGVIVVAIMPLFNYFYQAAAVKTTGYLRQDVFQKSPGYL